MNGRTLAWLILLVLAVIFAAFAVIVALHTVTAGHTQHSLAWLAASAGCGWGSLIFKP